MVGLLFGPFVSVYEGTTINIPHMMGYTEKLVEGTMSTRLIIEGNAVYEIDEECCSRKQAETHGKKDMNESGRRQTCKRGRKNTD